MTTYPGHAWLMEHWRTKKAGVMELGMGRGVYTSVLSVPPLFAQNPVDASRTHRLGLSMHTCVV